MAWWRKRKALPPGNASVLNEPAPTTQRLAQPTAADSSDDESTSETTLDPIPLEVTDVLDLHSFAPREVDAVVRTYLEEARARGFTTVRIIHGKGIGTQRALVRAVLSKTGFVVSYQDAPAEAGGWGATVVWFTLDRR